MDRYSITARIYPMIIFYLPLGVIFVAAVWDFQQYYHYGLPVGAAGVFAYLTAQIGRDAGKRKESKLWNGWGGAPTTQLFRWSNTQVDPHTKARSQEKMHQLCPGLPNTDRTSERNNPALADEVYQSWTTYIIAHTRDTKKYSMLFKENMGYGFRRNLWGLKPAAMALVGILMAATYIYFAVIKDSWKIRDFPSIFFLCEVLLGSTLLFWVTLVTKIWVRSSAFAYAKQIHEAIETL